MAMISNIQFQLQVRQIVGAQPRAEAIVVAIVMLMIIGRICAWVFGGFWHGETECVRGAFVHFHPLPKHSSFVEPVKVLVSTSCGCGYPVCHPALIQNVVLVWRGVLLPIARSSPPHPLDRLAWRSGRLAIVPLNHLNSRSSDVAMHMAHPLSHQYQY